MLRACAAVATAVLTFGSPAAIAHAEPEQPDQAGCTYTLTAPSVVTVSGVEMVTAIVDTGACDGAVTYQTVACIEMVGGNGPGRCEEGSGIVPAQVFFQPYRPGATYIATGRGCAAKGNPPQKYCRENGPLTAVL
ncbi:MAG: hypothetical protein SW019_15500 [Actinomycetota bacterium]|nr:hypothetical protein [Actinomycetota bacterium]